MADQKSSVAYRTKDLIIYIVVVITGFIMRRLPRRSVLWFGASLGGLLFRCIKRRREIALKNLKMAFGSEFNDEEIEQIARRSFRNAGMTMVEFLCVPKYKGERLLSLVRFEGMENYDKAVAEGKGFIAVSAHFGNWELVFLSSSVWVKGLSVIVQPLKYRRLDKLVNSHRTIYGGQIIEKRLAAKETLRQLNRGFCVAIMGDQNAGENGVFVDFFGRPASVSRGPIMFALRTGAPVINAFGIRQPDGSHIITISEPIEMEISGDREKDMEVNTAKFVKELEKIIRKYPDQWLWMHDRWKTRPDYEKNDQ